MRVFKYYVDVDTLIRADGSMRPLKVYWQNRRFLIDRVISVRETFSRAGGSGICYLCRFGNQERKLFWERNRWFLESEVYVPGMEENIPSGKTIG